MAARLAAPRYCIQHSRFTKQDGWQLEDLSLSSNGNIAVTGYNENTYRTYIDVYTNVRHSDSRDKPKIIYSKEFEKYEDEGSIYEFRCVSFIDDDVIVSCLGYKLEVFQVNKDEVLRSRRVNGSAMCLSVRERREIFIGFLESNKITVYDVIHLNEIKSIILQGIQDGYWPYDMTAIADKIFVCTTIGEDESNDKSLIFEEKNGRILSELTKPTDTVQWYVKGLALNITLNVIAVVWSHTDAGTRKGKDVIVFYSLLSENNCSFLIVEVKFGVWRIRISDRGDRMITGDSVTEECKVYDMSEFFSYGQLKESLQSQLHEDDRTKLTDFFALPDNQRDAIVKSDTPTENLFLALEGKGVIQPSNVDRLAKAFTELGIKSSCLHLVDFYQNTRFQATPYGRFLATLSAHLTASLPANLCRYFDISDEKKSSITSSPDPGLSLLLAVDEIGIINSSKVEALKQPLSELKLVQAEAKIHEYQLVIEEDRNQLQRQTELTETGKKKLFIQCLQKKIRSWYETMTPVPWKKSCRWKSTDLFVGSGLVLTDSKSKRSLTCIDEECKLQYHQIFNHERLKTEKRIILEGEPGSGKTMMSSQLAYDWSQGKISEVDILIFLPLKFVNHVTLVEAMKRFYFSAYDSISFSDIESFLTNEDLKCCLILDGLEEYNSGEMTKAGEPSEVAKVIEKSQYPNCKVILTSRSDYAKDLPKCPMLRIGQFGEKERNMYIKKVFANNTEKQQEIKRVIENNPFVLDLCSVPLLFVLAVHNIDSMGNLQESRLDRVSPFMNNMVRTLCSSPDSVRGQVGFDVKRGSEESQLAEFAYNGLCKGRQVLSWQKDMLEKYITKLKELLDSGILVAEEGIVKETSRGVQHVLEADEGVNAKKTKMEKEQIGAKDEANKATSGVPEPSAETETDESYHSGLTSGFTAKHFPLEVKFLHKVMQEWYAARYLSCMLWKSWLFNYLDAMISDVLPQISPTDLHYILRFTSYLCPPCCYLIMEFLLKRYRTEEGAVEEHILNCVFLCFAEYNGIMDECMKGAVAKVCGEVITMRSDESRLTQQSKMTLLRFASRTGILIKGVRLLDVVSEVGEHSFTFDSGVKFDVLNVVQMIEMHRWDQHLEDKDYSSIVKLVIGSHSIKRACLHFPNPPPKVDTGALGDAFMHDKRIEWIIGSGSIQTLNLKTYQWEPTPNREDIGSIGSAQMGAAKGELREQSLTETEAIITKNGGTITIPGTEVVLNIPPDALPEHLDQCLIEVRIIPRTVYHDPETTFSSNSSVVVEILPNKLLLRHPAQLKIPHCLLLKENETPTAAVFMSHHEEGCLPSWEEHSSLEYRVERTCCVVWLNSFCWVTMKIDEKEVLAKKLILFTWGKHLMPTDDHAEIEVGYYPDLEGEAQFLSLNKSAVVVKRSPFTFMKEGCHPLCWSLEKFPSNHWNLFFPEENRAEIAFRDISASVEKHCTFVLEKAFASAKNPMCIFKASQDEGVQPVTLSICPQQSKHFSSHASGSHSPSGSHSQAPMKSEVDVMNLAFRFLSRQLGNEWLAVGRELEVSNAELDQVKSDNTTQRDVIYAMLLYWKQREGSAATYAKLIKSLEEAGRKDLAEELQN